MTRSSRARHERRGRSARRTSRARRGVPGWPCVRSAGKGGEKAPYALHLWSDGALRFNANQYVPAGAVGGGSWNSSKKLSLARWQHVAATYDGANLRFHINGTLDRTVSANLIFGSTAEPERHRER